MKQRRSTGSFLAVVTLAVAVALPSAADPPQAPWVIEDIGQPVTPGVTDVDTNSVWSMKGARPSWIHETADRFHFVYQRLQGDASITARFLRGTFVSGGFEDVGLMVRQNSTPGAANVEYGMSIRGVSTWARFAPGQWTALLGTGGPNSGSIPNLFLRLQRVGQEISAFYSLDGLVWTPDSDPVPLGSLPEQALFGLWVSGRRNRTVTGQWDRVQVESGARLVPGVRSRTGNQRVLLEWSPLKEAVAYNVYRGPVGATRDQFVQVNTDRVAWNFFTDVGEGLVNGTPLTYAVAAVFRDVDGTLAQGPLVAVPATPVAVPAGWMGSSINGGPRPGAAAYDAATGQIALEGSGSGLGENADGFYFLSQMVEGDFQVTVKVLTQPTGSSNERLAGLMVRETLDAGARHLTIGIGPSVGLVSGGRASPYGEPFRSLAIRDLAFQPPIVLRLTRQGSTITPWYSTDDGKTFHPAGLPRTFAPPLGKMLSVGLAVSAGTLFQSRLLATQVKFGVPEFN